MKETLSLFINGFQGGGVTDVQVTIQPDDLDITYGDAITGVITCTVNGIPSDTLDTVSYNVDDSQIPVTPGVYNLKNYITPVVTYNDNPQKYNYIVTVNDGYLTISSPIPDIEL